MKLTIDEIRERVAQIEDARSEYNLRALRWERMWRMEPKNNDEAPKYAKDMDGVLSGENVSDRVILPTPYNVVALATRLVATMPRVEVPSNSGVAQDDENAQARESWLTAYWQRINRQSRRNLIEDFTWNMLVRGRAVAEVVWVQDQLPTRLRRRRLPVLVRSLDPLDCGFKYGPLYVECAYHKAIMRRQAIRQLYPNFRWDDELNRTNRRSDDTEATVTSIYYVDDDGAVWYAVVVDDKFAQEPEKTDWIDIPLIEIAGDSAPIDDELYRGISILHPIEGMWQLQNRFASDIVTALRYYFLPIVKVRNPDNLLLNPIEIGPNRTYTLPGNTDIQVERPDVNVPLANVMFGMIDAMIQQATFPGVMYGKEPGSIQAGYGVNILANQAKGRINVLRANLESLLEHINELLLFCVDSFADKKGITIWGVDDRIGNPYEITLATDQVDGQYSNVVRLIPEAPMDDMPRILQMMQLVERGLMSRMTFWDRGINIPVPQDEYLRILTEQLMESDEMRHKTWLRALQQRFPHNWRELIHGTPLQQVAEAEELYKSQQALERKARRLANAQRKYEETGIVSPGFVLMPNGLLAPANEQPMPQPMPPMPQPMPPMPQPMPPMPPQEPLPMQPPGIPGMAPEATGQLSPEMLGLAPQQGALPGQFQDFVGQEPIDQAELLRRLTNRPPGT